MTDLSRWTPRAGPARAPIRGRYVDLEPLDPGRHGDDLYAASSVPDAGERFRYLFDAPPGSRAEFGSTLEKAAAGEDPLVFAVVDRASGRARGRQSFMRIEKNHGVIEIGSIYWGPGLARERGATEALFLFARNAFDALGYRRFEWKCDNRNAPSKRAALRFGFTFEGVFRHHMVVKGKNRDTAWYAMVAEDWPAIARAFEAWLDPANFDAGGRQAERLEAFRGR